MTDRDLGLDRATNRRDFLQGALLGTGALALGAAAPAGVAEAGWPQDAPGYYPPALESLRGSHPGSFEAAHALRDGAAFGQGEDTGETYDLIVVGAGISGLSAAWFWRTAHPNARVLVLDNHDDFGGHAKRNEYRLGGKLHLMNGGTMLIDSPRPYSAVAGGLLRALGIDPVVLSKDCVRPEIYNGLGHGVFFDKATFGADRLVAGLPSNWHDDATAGGIAVHTRWEAFLAATPLGDAVKRDVLRIETGTTDYLPGLSDTAKADRLSRISYRDYLLNVARVSPGTIPFYQTRTHGEWAVGIDAVSALDCWGFGQPGFDGLGLKRHAYPRMSYTPRGYVEGGSDTFHFPDGNATIARLLVRALVPGAVPGTDARDVVTARADYSRLDRAENAVRIRLSSTALAVRHEGDPTSAGTVRVTYTRGGRVFAARAKAVVLAGWNAMIPHLVPELPETQKAALHGLVKSPLVYTTVALRNWQAFHRLGVSAVQAPGAYWSSMMLNWPVDVGGYTAERDPAKPILLFMERTPCAPGLSEHDQNRAGRAELLETPFVTFEREVRAQIAATLEPGGFDPARDITGITVNRWPHGYAPEYNLLWQPDIPEAEQPHVIGRARFGRIAIANSDAGGGAYTDVAIDQAWRAVSELG
jgi:spermidine dehydrogenase